MPRENFRNKLQGNVLINVGPTKEGTISPIYQERLLQLGQWLSINGEAIYSSTPWTRQEDSINKFTWYTCKKAATNPHNEATTPKPSDNVQVIYAIFLEWPKNKILVLKDITTALHSGSHSNVSLLGFNEPITWHIKNGTAYFTLPDKDEISSETAWTLKFESNDINNVEEIDRPFETDGLH